MTQAVMVVVMMMRLKGDDGFHETPVGGRNRLGGAGGGGIFLRRNPQVRSRLFVNGGSTEVLKPVLLDLDMGDFHWNSIAPMGVHVGSYGSPI